VSVCLCACVCGAVGRVYEFVSIHIVTELKMCRYNNAKGYISAIPVPSSLLCIVYKVKELLMHVMSVRLSAYS
jgi:hypothetical protein